MTALFRQRGFCGEEFLPMGQDPGQFSEGLVDLLEGVPRIVITLRVAKQASLGTRHGEQRNGTDQLF